MNWQPIETAPKNGTEILLCRATDADGKSIRGDAWGISVQVAAWWGDGWIVYCSLPSEPVLHFDPTHWMPLPENPLAPATEIDTFDFLCLNCQWAFDTEEMDEQDAVCPQCKSEQIEKWDTEEA